MSSASGYMGAKYFQEFGPRFFDMSSASEYMGEEYFLELGPRFLASHVIFGVSCSKCCVSWRVNINRVNNFRFTLCQNPACQRVHAMSWPPCILFGVKCSLKTFLEHAVLSCPAVNRFEP